jgi:hypothetical protein
VKTDLPIRACTSSRSFASRPGLLAASGLLAVLCACTGEAPPPAAGEEEAAAAPTNRIDIPSTVRRNLGIEFASVEPRIVERTMRVPGRFELLPTARREYRAPLDGRIELLVDQFEVVEAGTPLYRLEGSGWRDLGERIAATRARLESMGPVRQAHGVHERSLADKVELWRERLAQLDRLREAGGGSGAATTEARATLNATQAELAEVMEKDAELQATERVLAAELRALEAERAFLRRAAACGEGAAADASGLVVCASAAGVVEALAATPGGHAEEGGLVLSVVQPDRLRFRGRVLQGDLDRLRDGLTARIAAATADEAGSLPPVEATIALDLAADPDRRTIDVIATPTSAAAWAKAGLAASLEIVLDGGREELAIPERAVLRDGIVPIVFRRDPRDPDRAIRLEADLGRSDGRFIEILSGVAAGDEVVVSGNYQLVLAMSGSMPKGGHFHADGTFHAEDH